MSVIADPVEVARNSSQEPPRALRYRSDIDGLRTVAVVPVCLFHADLALFEGGFAGVDVFFVISGYLMTCVIGQMLLNGRFSYATFYERRARRLLPALLVVLVFSFAAASAVILPKLFQDFCRTVVGTVLFVSNVLFWRKTSNYFDAGTELNPLLHTWSLAVEEQFYIVFPVYLALVWRLRASSRLALTAMVALGSFAASVWATQNAPTAAFYLAPSRAWELLIGVLVALPVLHTATNTGATSKLSTELGAALGLLLVVGSFFFLDSEVPFPGFAALAPCVGTGLLIHFGSAGYAKATQLLASRPLVFIGKISYSLYLWHWPLIVFFDKYEVFGRPSMAHRAAALLCALVMAVLSWRYVEEPFRRGERVSRRKLIGIVLIGSTLLVAAGHEGDASGGWPARHPGLAEVSLEKQELRDARATPVLKHPGKGCFVSTRSDWGEEDCFLSHSGHSNALLWGDSFAENYARGFRANTVVQANVLQYTSPRCPPVLALDAASNPQCHGFNAAVDDVLSKYNIKTVIMGGSWWSYLRKRKLSYAEIAATIDFLHARGVYVILIGQGPHFSFTWPDEYFYKRFGVGSLDQTSYAAEVEVDDSVNIHLQRAVGADAFFNPMAILCRDLECTFKEGSEYIFLDYGHYTAFGSKKMVDALVPLVDRAAAATSAGL